MTGSGDPPSSDAALEVLRMLLLAGELRQRRASIGIAGAGRSPTPTRSAPLDGLAPMLAGAMALDPEAGDLLGLSPDVPEAVLAMGIEPAEIIGKWLARSGSPDDGRPPADQWTDLSRGVLGPFRPAGTGVEVMAGIALAFRMGSERRVCLLQCAGGEVTTGAWHEGLNFAAVRKVPLVVMVPAPSVEPTAGTRLRTLMEVCDGYGIRGEAIEGTSPLEIRERVAAAVEAARGGEGVHLLEVHPLSIEGFTARMDGGERLSSNAARMIAGLWEEANSHPAPEPSGALHEVVTGVGVSVPWYREGLTPGTPRGGLADSSRSDHRSPEAE